jgi:hypothetical protein
MTMIDTPQDHYTEALHATRDDAWKYHRFDRDHLPPPTYTKNWKPSCDDEGRGHWSRCYECNHFIATLLVDKAKFLAQKQLEGECPDTPHPNPSLLRPHRFYYGTDIDNKDDPKRKKAATGTT